MNKELSTMTQAQQLRSLFPGCKLEVGRRKLIWCYDLQPTAHSRCYTVKIKYHPNSKGVMTPDTYVMFPKHLPLAEGKYKLPHVYCNESQKICLYDWRNKEWNPTMSLATTIVPWASEWLYFYEVWVMTGEWYGEGNHPGDNKEEKRIILLISRNNTIHWNRGLIIVLLLRLAISFYILCADKDNKNNAFPV